MIIKATTKDFEVISKAFEKSLFITKNKIKIEITTDSMSSIVIPTETEGEFRLWTRGVNNILSFLNKGYVEIRRNCPMRPFFGKCNPKKCGFYVIKDGTGDCMFAWQAVKSGVIQ